MHGKSDAKASMTALSWSLRKTIPRHCAGCALKRDWGVQGTITDAQSKRILQDVIAPHFRQNDFYGGLVAGVSAITGLLDQEQFPAPTAKRAQQGADPGFAGLIPLLFFALMFIGGIRSRARRRNTLSRNHWGPAAGIILGSAIGRRGGFGGGGGGGGGG
jgi:uncharacterized protein